MQARLPQHGYPTLNHYHSLGHIQIRLTPDHLEVIATGDFLISDEETAKLEKEIQLLVISIRPEPNERH